MSGALPFACDAVAAAPDAHQKLHAVALLTTCLQRIKECLEVQSLPISAVQLLCRFLPCKTPPVCVLARLPNQIWSSDALGAGAYL